MEDHQTRANIPEFMCLGLWKNEERCKKESYQKKKSSKK